MHCNAGRIYSMKSYKDELSLNQLKQKMLEAEKLIESNKKDNRLGGAIKAMIAISDFFKKEHPRLSQSPIKMIIKELTDIYQGSKPKVFKNYIKKEGGRPILVDQKKAEEAIVAAIDLMVEDGEKVKESIDIAANYLKSRSPSQLTNIRKKLKAGRNIEAKDSLLILKEKGRSTGNLRESSKSLLEIAKKHLK